MPPEHFFYDDPAPSSWLPSMPLARPRLYQLLEEALRQPLVVISAGAGFGKSSIAHDFFRQYDALTTWIQLSEHDNMPSRFWEHYVNTVTKLDAQFAERAATIGFPKEEQSLSAYLALLHEAFSAQRIHILVLDDFHLITEPRMLRSFEALTQNLAPNWRMVFLSRTSPERGMPNLFIREDIARIGEKDLRFTDDEISAYFQQLGIPLTLEELSNIALDTDGWAFAIRLIELFFSRMPEPKRYIRSAVRQNLFKVIENEIFLRASKRLQRFLIRLSLIDILSADLVLELAGDASLIEELDQLNACIHFDVYLNAYLIHHLFLDLLRHKQSLLTEKERCDTYRIAAQWAQCNGYTIDAISYYDQCGGYEQIVRIVAKLVTQLPLDTMVFALEIFDRLPEEVLNTVALSAVMHLRLAFGTGQLERALELAAMYEKKYLAMGDTQFASQMLAGVYYCWGITRLLRSTVDHRYDSHLYFSRQDACMTKYPSGMPGAAAELPAGCWAISVGSAREGAPEESIDSLRLSSFHVSHALNGTMSGWSEIALGELAFYRNNLEEAETHLALGFSKAIQCEQFDVSHRALCYLLRIGFAQGDLPKAERAFDALGALLNEKGYEARQKTHDIAKGLYAFLLRDPGGVPNWLRGNFSAYAHPSLPENLGNQIKLRYRYMVRDYPAVLSCLEELLGRESVLYGRVEALAMGACVLYQMRNKEEAFKTLLKAYENAAPNRLLMPFLELGKDMRTLTASALREEGIGIPREWLKKVNQHASAYAKQRAHTILAYNAAHHMQAGIQLSAREAQVLRDLSHGLSRSEIAASEGISLNTVKLVLHSIYGKLGASSLTDAIRIATERGLVH
ncbi:MAG: LuxR C-terminal-related transcriptional regulator [Christensenellaceae bacterium]|nr:LuxR C-terminal-related transcriptional regulator [Christensenellaceae bacterium]